MAFSISNNRVVKTPSTDKARKVASSSNNQIVEISPSDEEIQKQISDMLMLQHRSRTKKARIKHFKAIFGFILNHRQFLERHAEFKEIFRKKLIQFYIETPAERPFFSKAYVDVFGICITSSSAVMAQMFDKMGDDPSRVTTLGPQGDSHKRQSFDLYVYQNNENVAIATVALKHLEKSSWMPAGREAYIAYFRMTPGSKSKGKCTQAFADLCTYLRKKVGVMTIRLYVSSNEWQAACKCYVKGAKLAGLESLTTVEGVCKDSTRFIFALPEHAKAARKVIAKWIELDPGTVSYLMEKTN
jgi:hypothetical protein